MSTCLKADLWRKLHQRSPYETPPYFLIQIFAESATKWLFIQQESCVRHVVRRWGPRRMHMSIHQMSNSIVVPVEFAWSLWPEIAFLVPLDRISHAFLAIMISCCSRFPDCQLICHVMQVRSLASAIHVGKIQTFVGLYAIRPHSNTTTRLAISCSHRNRSFSHNNQHTQM